MKRILSAVLCAVLLLALVPVLPQTVSAASLTNFNIRLNEPIASYTPDFSPEFNTNATVYSNVTWQENSPGFNMKLNSSDEFKAGLAYKVEIWVRLGAGNSFATDSYGDLAAAITVNGKAISSLKIEERNAQNQIVEVTITCNYDPLPGREISSVLIKGVPTPVAGNMPGYSFTIEGSSYGFYPTEPVVWRDKTNNFKQLDSSDTFIQGHEYQLCIWLSANREGGFTFRTDQYGNPQVNVTINSWAPDKVNKAYEQDGREVIEILYTFPACAAAHTCQPKLVPMQKQTCVMPGFKAYYECACGKCYEDAAGTKLITDMDGYGIIPADGHKEGDWSYNGTHHYKKCTTCREIIPGTEAAHSGGTASCIEKAQCSTCGASYGELDSEHRWGPGWDYKDASGHAWICADCKTHSEIYAHKPGPAATETSPQTCTDCGYVIQPALHVHTPGDLRYNSGEHYRYCTVCGEMMENENHKGGKATCVEKGKCTVCGYAYLPENEDHTPDTKWTACAGLYHAKLCKLCGAHCTPEEHKPGAAATETSPQTCTVCGYIITPAKNHTHKLSKVEMVPATCLKEGMKEHYACSGCSDKFTDAEGKNKIPESETLKLPALEHEYSGQWEHSDTEHWMICGNCKEPLEQTRMKHDLQNGKCQLCGYTEKAGTDETPSTGTGPTDTTPAATDPKSPEKDNNGMPWWGYVIIILGGINAGIGIAFILIKLKKKS